MKSMKGITATQRRTWQSKFVPGMLVRLDKTGTPWYVWATTPSCTTDLILSPVRLVDNATPIKSGSSHVYGDNPVFKFENLKYEAYEKPYQRGSRERAFSAIYSVFVDGKWIRIDDFLNC